MNRLTLTLLTALLLAPLAALHAGDLAEVGPGFDVYKGDATCL